jgi:hypothetical protein
MSKNEPYSGRLGWLRNGNPPGGPRLAPRCGAKTRKGTSCLSPAVRGKRRCRMHGGVSTGPLTQKGLARSKRANWKHGFYSEEEKNKAKLVRRLLRECQDHHRALSKNT